MTTLTTTTLRLTATAALVLTTTLAGAGAGTASDHQASNAADEYVAMLVAKAEAATPYSQAGDYVDTLVYWRHHPRWGFGS